MNMPKRNKQLINQIEELENILGSFLVCMNRDFYDFLQQWNSFGQDIEGDALRSMRDSFMGNVTGVTEEGAVKYTENSMRLAAKVALGQKLVELFYKTIVGAEEAAVKDGIIDSEDLVGVEDIADKGGRGGDDFDINDFLSGLNDGA